MSLGLACPGGKTKYLSLEEGFISSCLDSAAFSYNPGLSKEDRDLGIVFWGVSYIYLSVLLDSREVVQTLREGQALSLSKLEQLHVEQGLPEQVGQVTFMVIPH